MAIAGTGGLLTGLTAAFGSLVALVSNPGFLLALYREAHTGVDDGSHPIARLVSSALVLTLWLGASGLALLVGRPWFIRDS